MPINTSCESAIRVGVAALIATKNREELLLERSVPTVRRQTLAPNEIVVVNDGEPFSDAVRRRLQSSTNRSRITLLENDRTTGVAGAWNTALAHLIGTGHRGFVAILDDDDEWDPDHLDANAAAAIEHQADAVVSGLRMQTNGGSNSRSPLKRLCDRDFLTGNPGWQGSNTFVSLALMARVGGFREGLLSLNDRDLAIRILRVPGVRVERLSRWTATWHLGTTSCLSEPRGRAKLSGLRWFWTIYGDEMTLPERRAFMQRAASLFGIEEADIVKPGGDLPPRRAGRGDLRG